MSGGKGESGLDWLNDRPGARRPRKRVGRGPGSGRGKTSGRGVKGQRSRSGVSLGAFEGGQMPIHMRMPKRGFRNAPFGTRPVAVNLDRLQEAVDAGRLDPAQTVDMAALKRAGVVRRAPDGVRVLGRGALKQGLRIEAAGISASALAALKAAGGSFTAVASGLNGAKVGEKPQDAPKAGETPQAAPKEAQEAKTAAGDGEEAAAAAEAARVTPEEEKPAEAAAEGEAAEDAGAESESNEDSESGADEEERGSGT